MARGVRHALADRTLFTPMLHTDPTHRVDVAVVGGGLSGLVAAVALRRAGLETAVVEARDRLGGRVEAMPGGGADLGPAWFWPHHRHMAHLVEARGLGTFEQPTAGDAMWDAASGGGAVRVPGGGDEAPSFRVVGGMSALVDSLARDVGPVVLGAPVERIVRTDDGAEVTARRASGEPVVVKARAVVVALPPALAAQTLAFGPPLEPERMRLLGSVATWMSWSMKVALAYPEATWRRAGLSGLGLSPGGFVSQFFDATEPGDDALAVLVGWADPVRAQRMTPDERRREATAQATRLFGVGAPTAYAERDWSAEPFTTEAGGQAAGLGLFGHARLRDTLWDGRLHLAGAETAAESPGYLDGAVVRGEEVARAVVASLTAVS